MNQNHSTVPALKDLHAIMAKNDVKSKIVMWKRETTKKALATSKIEKAKISVREYYRTTLKVNMCLRIMSWRRNFTRTKDETTGQVSVALRAEIEKKENNIQSMRAHSFERRLVVHRNRVFHKLVQICLQNWYRKRKEDIGSKRTREEQIIKNRQIIIKATKICQGMLTRLWKSDVGVRLMLWRSSYLRKTMEQTKADSQLKLSVANSMMNALWVHAMRKATASLQKLLQRIILGELKMRLVVWHTKWYLSPGRTTDPWASRVVASSPTSRGPRSSWVGERSSLMTGTNLRDSGMQASFMPDQEATFSSLAWSREEKLAHAAVRWTWREMEMEIHARLAQIDAERDDYLGAAMECVLDEAAEHAMAIQDLEEAKNKALAESQKSDQEAQLCRTASHAMVIEAQEEMDLQQEEIDRLRSALSHVTGGGAMTSSPPLFKGELKNNESAMHVQSLSSAEMMPHDYKSPSNNYATPETSPSPLFGPSHESPSDGADTKTTRAKNQNDKGWSPSNYLGFY